MADIVAAEILDERLLDLVVIVPVVERSGPGKEIDPGTAILGMEHRALRSLKDDGERPAVRAYAGLMLFENLGAHYRLIMM
jgi:hypothetical protein